MAWHDLPADVREVAENTLTPRQLEVLMLSSAGMTDRRIASTTGVSRRTVRDHFDAATDKLLRAGVRPEGGGLVFVSGGTAAPIVG